MFRTKMGVPLGEAPTTIFSMSARLVMSASPRISDCCSNTLQVGAAGVRVVLLQRRNDLLKGNVIGHQLVAVDLHFIRL